MGGCRRYVWWQQRLKVAEAKVVGPVQGRIQGGQVGAYALTQLPKIAPAYPSNLFIYFFFLFTYYDYAFIHSDYTSFLMF
jgi:hypothetical protein